MLNAGCGKQEENEKLEAKNATGVTQEIVAATNVTIETQKQLVEKEIQSNCKNIINIIDEKTCDFDVLLNKHIKAGQNLYSWTNLPYAGRVEAAMKKMKELPESKMEEFANWHEWHDPKVGFVLYSELAKNKACTSVYERIYLHSGAVCCLGSSKEYDKAWKYIEENLIINDNIYEDAWMCRVIADIAQRRADYEKEVLFSKKIWELVSNSKNQGKVKVDVSEAVQRYCIGLYNAEDFIELGNVISKVENDNYNNIDDFIKKWLQNRKEKIKKYNPSGKTYMSKYKTYSWPRNNDFE